MPTGPATNKTEFQRYLNAHPDAVPALRAIAKTYAANPHGKHTFGFWLRVKYRATFDAAYSAWWLHRPSLYGKVYDEESPSQINQNMSSYHLC